MPGAETGGCRHSAALAAQRGRGRCRIFCWQSLRTFLLREHAEVRAVRLRGACAGAGAACGAGQCAQLSPAGDQPNPAATQSSHVRRLANFEHIVGVSQAAKAHRAALNRIIVQPRCAFGRRRQPSYALGDCVCPDGGTQPTKVPHTGADSRRGTSQIPAGQAAAPRVTAALGTELGRARRSLSDSSHTRGAWQLTIASVSSARQCATIICSSPYNIYCLQLYTRLTMPLEHFDFSENANSTICSESRKARRRRHTERADGQPSLSARAIRAHDARMRGVSTGADQPLWVLTRGGRLTPPAPSWPQRKWNSPQAGVSSFPLRGGGMTAR